jgi:hypothetical protein
MLMNGLSGCPHLREMQSILEASDSDGVLTDAGMLYAQLMMLEWRAMEEGASPRSLMVIGNMRRMADELAATSYANGCVTA